jgi:sodium/potassium-transporting ATPase subunit alpha
MSPLAPQDLELGSDDAPEPADVEAQYPPVPQRITFEPDNRRGRNYNDTTATRRRSASRDSISSVRSRTRSVSGVPIEFRSLSFQVEESQALDETKPRGKPAKPKKADKDTKEEDKDYFANLDFHILEPVQVCNELNVIPEKGLSSSEAASRLSRDGPNTFPGRRENYLKKIFFYVFGGFCSVLWVGVIIFFICWRPLGDPNPAAYNLGLGILVLIVIFLQASFSAFQDWSTARTMKSILNLLPAESVAIRDGESRKINSVDLVVGDIVKVTIGNKVPADIRILSTSGDVRFDRSMLTGESEEVEGNIRMTDKNFLETRNVALMGTMVTNGSATGVVILTGGNSVMGRIANATTSIKDVPTHIQREISRFVKIIVCLTIVLACTILFTWVGWIRVDHFTFMNVVQMLNNVMGCVVAFIPEGMPVAVALTLMIVARRMRSNNILPKGLATVETLGCVNILCSDKTGTLTENRMVVTTVSFVDKRMPVNEALVMLSADQSQSQALENLHQASILCNDASFDVLTIDRPVLERDI